MNGKLSERRRQLGRVWGATALTATLATGLAACADADDPAATPATESSTTASASTQVYPRTVDGYRGPVTLERAPKRVATVNLNYTGPFLEPFLGNNGVELVGYGTARDISKYNPWLVDMAAGVPDFDNTDGPNLEELVGYDPDIIIGNGNGDYWDAAEQVAPLLNFDDSDWRQATRLFGDVLDATAIADDTVADTEKLIADAKLARPAKVALIWADTNDGNVTFAYAGAAFADVIKELGLETGPGTDPESGGYETVSLELVAERLEVDWAIVLNFSIGSDTADVQEKLLANPILRRAPVIAEGRFVTLTPQQTQAGNPAAPTTIPLVIEAMEPILEQD